MPITKSEIERVINGKEDFVKIDYLNRYLNHIDNFDVKKFILLNLASIYESKNMVPLAVRHLNSATDIALNNREKIELYMKIVGLYIKIRNFPQAENALKQAMYIAPELERLRLKSKCLDIFWNSAKEAETKEKGRHAFEIYKHMLTLSMPEDKRTELKEKLLNYYNKMGRVREYNKLKASR